MKTILQSYKDLYNQIVGQLAVNNISHQERKSLIEMLYNTEINLNRAQIEVNKLG